MQTRKWRPDLICQYLNLIPPCLSTNKMTTSVREISASQCVRWPLGRGYYLRENQTYSGLGKTS